MREKNKSNNDNIKADEGRNEVLVSIHRDHCVEFPSKEELITWCSKETNHLEHLRKSAVSTSIENRINAIKNEIPVVNERIVSTLDRQSKHPRNVSMRSSIEFRRDIQYFEQNKHPSIQEMINIAAEAGVRYEGVFFRFNELRMWTRERCDCNDTCQRVLKYFNPKTIFNVASVEQKVFEMREEFKTFDKIKPELSTGAIHLLVDKYLLPPEIVQDLYHEWYMDIFREEVPDLNELIKNEEAIINLEISGADINVNNAHNDHDYIPDEIPYDCRLRSLLRIITKKPDLTVADAVILAKIYKVDLKFIQKLIQGDKVDSRNKKKTVNKSTVSPCISIGKNPEVIRVSIPEQLYHLDSSDIRYDENFIDVAQYEDVVDSEISDPVPQVESLPIKDISENADEGEEGTELLKKKSRQFPEDFKYFEKNRHPTVQEMIDISKLLKITYRQVFYRFRDFRSTFKEECPVGCTCDKVSKLFAQRAAFNGIFDAKTVNYIYELFDSFGYTGKNPNIGYIHLVAVKVDLPAFIVKDQYKDWLLETNDSIKLSMTYEETYENLEKEFLRDPTLSYERLIQLASDYGTTQKHVLNSYDSYIDIIESLDNDMSAEDRPPVLTAELPTTSNQISHSQPSKQDDQLYLASLDKMGKECDNSKSGEADEHILKNCFYETTGGSIHNLFESSGPLTLSETPSRSENIERARKMKFNMKRSRKGPQDSHGNQRKSDIGDSDYLISKHAETEDEEIDIVGYDESVPNSPIDELARTFVQSNPCVYGFPGDLKLFEKNRHPSIAAMIEISKKMGIKYEDVFFRFQTLRNLTNETCSAGDTCQKVEIYNQIYPDLNGVLNEETHNFMCKAFQKNHTVGPNLPLGLIHLIMDKVQLPSRVIRMQYAEWYTKLHDKNKSPTKLPTGSDSSEEKKPKLPRSVDKRTVSRKRTHDVTGEA